jgi:DNA replication protein DnaC
MSAFLKIDQCRACRRMIPWEWAPAVMAAGKALAGTGVWRSQLIGGQCPACEARQEAEREKEQQALLLRAKLIALMGGEKPYREFTFERYVVASGNRLAYERCRSFNPATDNLYLWGACGVGKTHLAWAAARRCFQETLAGLILPAYQLSRKVRMKEPDEEQAAIDEFIDTDVLVLDDLGSGPDTAYGRQILQEILDGRDFHDRAGLIVTSAYSFDTLAQKMGHDTIPSRLVGMCEVLKIEGNDHRLLTRSKPAARTISEPPPPKAGAP